MYCNHLIIISSDRIRYEITKKQKAFKLVEIVISRGPGAYNSFRKSLLEYYGHLVENLDNTVLTSEELKPTLVRKSSADGNIIILQKKKKTTKTLELSGLKPELHLNFRVRTRV